MLKTVTLSGAVLVALAAAACSADPSGGPLPTSEDAAAQPMAGAGGKGAPKGGSGGSVRGAGGAGGAGGGQLAPDASDGSGGAPAIDAAPVDSAEAAEAGGVPPTGSQGPTATGRIVFSQDFEQNMDGMSRSPPSLPEDRIQIIDDPVGMRGKIVRIMFKDGDNFRTSPGTQPRSWFSAAKGYTVKPGTKVSLAWGFMWENVNMNAHFAQIIRDGGPIWMWDVDGSGNVSMTFHRGSGRTGNIMKLEPMKWYDFMVVTDYREGGECQFYLNGKMVGTGRSVGGPDARFDFGIYTRAGAHPARTVFISNVSIGEL